MKNTIIADDMKIKEFVTQYFQIVRVHIYYIFRDKYPVHRIIEIYLFGIPVYRKVHKDFSFEQEVILARRK